MQREPPSSHVHWCPAGRGRLRAGARHDRSSGESAAGSWHRAPYRVPYRRGSAHPRSDAARRSRDFRSEARRPAYRAGGRAPRPWRCRRTRARRRDQDFGNAPAARIAAWTYLSLTVWIQPPRPLSLRQEEMPTSGRGEVRFIAVPNPAKTRGLSSPTLRLPWQLPAPPHLPASCAVQPCMVPPAAQTPRKAEHDRHAASRPLLFPASRSRVRSPSTASTSRT